MSCGYISSIRGLRKCVVQIYDLLTLLTNRNQQVSEVNVKVNVDLYSASS